LLAFLRIISLGRHISAHCGFFGPSACTHTFFLYSPLARLLLHVYERLLWNFLAHYWPLGARWSLRVRVVVYRRNDNVEVAVEITVYVQVCTPM
jgi:hypothetical protein